MLSKLHTQAQLVHPFLMAWLCSLMFSCNSRRTSASSDQKEAPKAHVVIAPSVRKSANNQPQAPLDPEAAMAANAAELNKINTESLVRWTIEEQEKRTIILDGEAEYSSQFRLPFCPEASTIRERHARDEFARKKNENDLARAKSSCFSRIQNELKNSGLPKDIVIIESAIGLREDYDFERQCFWLHVGLGGLAAGGQDLFFPHRIGSLMVLGDWDAYACSRKRGLLILEDTYATRGLIEQKDHLNVAVPIPEDRALALKKRLSDEKGKLRMQIAIRLSGYAPSGLTCGLFARPGQLPATRLVPVDDPGDKPVKAFRGKAIGFRVLDKKGVLTPWIPMGPFPPAPTDAVAKSASVRAG